MLNNISILALIFALTSCANLSKVLNLNSNPNDTAVKKTSGVDLSPLRKRAQAASVEASENQEEHRIIGTSKIQESKKHHTKTYYLYGAEHLNLDNYFFDIPIVYNAKVRRWVDYFLTRGRGLFERYSARAGKYGPLMGQILEEHGLPRDLLFLAMAESGFHNKAKSWAKAVGPWQFMPYTGKAYGLNQDWYVDERRDPVKATVGAAKYLTKLYKEFGSWELAAAGYNAGEGKMNRAIKRYRTENFWKISRGRYLKRETKNYVPKIMALAILGKNLKAFGFNEIDFHEALDFEEVSVEPMTDLYKVAEVLDVEFEELQYLNPELLRWFTPPHKGYKLRLPVGKKVSWNGCCTNELEKFAVVESDLMEYKIKGRSARLHNVGKKFKIKNKYKYVLEELNKKTWKTRLGRGDVVLLPFRKGQNLKDNMYADLHERPRRSVRRRRSYKKRIRMAIRRRGKRISNPVGWYTVKKGDSLWTVSRKNGISLDSLIVSNLKIVKRRQIRAGDKLVVR